MADFASCLDNLLGNSRESLGCCVRWIHAVWGLHPSEMSVSGQQSASRILASDLVAMVSIRPGSRWSDRPPWRVAIRLAGSWVFAFFDHE